MQRTWLDFATEGWSSGRVWRGDWPCYDTPRRATLVIRSASDVVVDDPDAARRSAWEDLY
jgi:para-nitrobenzyl esterase